LDFALLCAAAFATAVLSAVVGMAGGITLLAAMLLWLPPLVVIPLHGVIQLASNGSRTWFQRRHARFDILWRYALLLLPGGLAGLAVARSLPEEGLRAAIAGFVLLATWAPVARARWRASRHAGVRADVAAGDSEGAAAGGGSSTAEREGAGGTAQLWRRFLPLGAAAGFLNVTIGAVGPLIAPFFLNLGLRRQALVGTKAACQTLGHLVKLAIFGGAGFAFQEHLPLLVGACLCVLAGTWLGSRLLERASESLFIALYRGVLTLIALRLAGSALLA
ncbi:MAG: sulfite exporter TauE/SafE family protein, partial [Deltaproteobacteria bacterium]|nr:sulfite exporter TauE/SafE family protein [Deltaproteobacteria bacterium]